MKTVSFYDLTTGLFAGRTFASTDEDQIEQHTPDGHGHVEGVHDHLSRRVDLATGEVVDHQPEQPSADFEWDAQAKRWKLSAAVLASQQARSSAMTEIARLEAACIRPLRELALGIAGAHDRLAGLEAAIATERARL
jgi:hypothetical protein